MYIIIPDPVSSCVSLAPPAQAYDISNRRQAGVIEYICALHSVCRVQSRVDLFAGFFHMLKHTPARDPRNAQRETKGANNIALVYVRVMQRAIIETVIPRVYTAGEDFC